MASDAQLRFFEDQFGITIVEDTKLEKQLIENLEKQYARERKDVHVSDLVLCMRAALLRQLKPAKPTLKTISYFFDGARRHESLQSLYAGEGIIAEKKGEFEGVSYSIDIYDNSVPEFCPYCQKRLKI